MNRRDSVHAAVRQLRHEGKKRALVMALMGTALVDGPAPIPARRLLTALRDPGWIDKGLLDEPGFQGNWNRCMTHLDGLLDRLVKDGYLTRQPQRRRPDGAPMATVWDLGPATMRRRRVAA